MRIVFFLPALLIFQSGIAQSIGIGTANPHPSARLEIKSTSQGILIPSLTAAERSAINNPAIGLLVFQKDGSMGFYYYTGIAWVNLTNGVRVNTEGIAVSSEYGITTTLAGSGNPGDIDGTGPGAFFEFPSGICVDASGTVFIADQINNKIKKITTSGVATTFAGDGNGGDDNGGPTEASFTRPAGLAIDASGNIYVADMLNNNIRRIDPDGQVSTYAGNGAPDSTNGPADLASFFAPSGVAVDASGNVYVADTRNHKIRKITAATGMVSTLAGNGTQGSDDGIGENATFRNPWGIAVDVFGNIFVAERNNHKIRKITAAGEVSTFAGSGIAGFADGPGTSAQFNFPTGLTIDVFGNMYVGDGSNNRIRKITPAGLVSTLAGNGTEGAEDDTGTAARFKIPGAVAADAFGNLYVADEINYKVRKIIIR